MQTIMNFNTNRYRRNRPTAAAGAAGLGAAGLGAAGLGAAGGGLVVDTRSSTKSLSGNLSS